MTEKNIVVIGAGYWGKNLVSNFHQLGVLKTICDGAQPIREEMRAAWGTDFKSVPLCITANVSDVLRDNDITGVVIATPAALHFAKTRLWSLRGDHRPTKQSHKHSINHEIATALRASQ